jgi:hypothetical protein
VKERLKEITSRLRFYHFAVLAWVSLTWDSLDGHLGEDPATFNLWRFMAAWYVLVGGLYILTYLFTNTLRHRLPMTLAWICFGSGLLFWSTVATQGWPLFAITAIGAFWQGVLTARGSEDD